MRRRLKGCTLALVVIGLIAVQWALTAQAPGASKRPLSYDAVDYWRSIQGTRLSTDGQWLAYALTSQAEDGELVVRNLRTGQEYRHARAGLTFTEDGKFCVFTIAQSKADEEKERLDTGITGQAPAPGLGGQGTGRGGQATRNQRTGLAS
jgi:hypothetical protein